MTSAWGEPLAMLNALTSRTFNVCGLCPHGVFVDGHGTEPVAVLDIPDIGEMRVCAVHAAEFPRWRRAEETETRLP